MASIPPVSSPRPAAPRPASRRIGPRPARILGAAVLLTLLTGLAACGGGGPGVAVPTVGDLSKHGGTLRIDLASDFDTTLRRLGVTPGSFQAARLTADTPGGTVLLPVSGGHLSEVSTAPAGAAGVLEADDAGITFTKADQTLTVGNLDVDLSHSVVYGDVAVGATVQATHIVLFDLDDKALRADVTAGTVVLSGGRAFFSLRLAKLFDETFQAQAVDGDSLLGTTTYALER